MNTIEALVRDNPAITQIGQKTLVALAAEDAIKAEPSLWTQGANQVEEYLGEIRRGEAGPELKSRLEAIFPSKTLKR